MNITVGRQYLWKSKRGYSKPEGEQCETYEVDYETRRAGINVAGDEQCPEGYSYWVSFDELSTLPEVTQS